MDNGQRVLISQNDDGTHICPLCGHPAAFARTMRKHVERTHGIRATTKIHQTQEERRARQRQYERDHREKKKRNDGQRKTSHKKKVHFERPCLTVADANRRGVFNASHPIVTYGPSKIEGAGNGVFAAIDLERGDIVTRLEGTVVDRVPDESSYTVDLPVRSGRAKYLDCVRTPITGKGLGGFVNREQRDQACSRKNCAIIADRGKVYVQILTHIQEGRELYTTYGRGYRLKEGRDY